MTACEVVGVVDRNLPYTSYRHWGVAITEDTKSTANRAYARLGSARLFSTKDCIPVGQCRSQLKSQLKLYELALHHKHHRTNSSSGLRTSNLLGDLSRRLVQTQHRPTASGWPIVTRLIEVRFLVLGHPLQLASMV